MDFVFVGAPGLGRIGFQFSFFSNASKQDPSVRRSCSSSIFIFERSLEAVDFLEEKPKALLL